MGWLKYLEILLFILFLGCAVGLPIWYCKSFYAQRAKRQRGAEEHLLRHGGERVLEWNGEAPPGEADAEYGTLLVEVAAKRGGENARFYEKGLAVGKRRMPYSDIRDVVYAAGTPGKKYTAKAAVRDAAVLWIYPKKGMAFSISELNYALDDQVMENIKKGLGF